MVEVYRAFLHEMLTTLIRLQSPSSLPAKLSILISASPILETSVGDSRREAFLIVRAHFAYPGYLSDYHIQILFGYTLDYTNQVVPNAYYGLDDGTGWVVG